MRTLILSALLAGVAVSAPPANFSGKWAIETPGRGGRAGQTVLVLNQVGKAVTGTITTRSDVGTGSPVNTEILGGIAEGDTISFYVWTGTDQPVKTMYKGTMSGEEITFTVTGGPARMGGFGGPQGAAPGAPREVKAKRAK